MNSRRAGTLFLIQILISVVFILLINFFYPLFNLGIVENAVLSEAMLFVPAIGMIVAYESKPQVLLSLGKFKISDFFLVIVFTMFVSPLISFVNIMSQLVTVNRVTQISDQVLDMPMWMMLFLIGIYGPIAEEFAFRGVIYGSLRRTGNVHGAIILQAFLFGLMHGNLNQFCYAFVIGVLMGYLLEATGSIFSTICMHVYINSVNVGMLYMVDKMQGGAEELTQQASDISKSMLLMVAAIVLIFAVFGTTLAYLILRVLAEKNGRLLWLRDMGKLERYGSLKSPQLIIGILIAVGLIVADMIAQRMPMAG